MSMMSSYRYGRYDPNCEGEYDDDQDRDGEIPPPLRREMARHARRVLLRRLRLAWLAGVLLVSLGAVLTTALLQAAGSTLQGVGAAVLACLGLLQLFAASMPKRRRA